MDSIRIDIKNLIIKSEDKNLVYGEVYVPYHIDTDNEFMLPDGIRKLAYDFITSGMIDKIDIMHNQEPCGAKVVESFIARKGDPDFKEGAWVLGAWIPPGNTWNSVKKGELNGFSFQAKGTSTPVLVEVEVTEYIKGDTEDSTSSEVEKHTHSIHIKFTDNGKIIPTKTGETLGHTHDIIKATATELTSDHAHRIQVIDD